MPRPHKKQSVAKTTVRKTSKAATRSKPTKSFKLVNGPKSVKPTTPIKATKPVKPTRPVKALKAAKQVKTPKTIASTQSLSAFVKSICDIMRRSNCASALQYVPELTWILFLRLLDAQEERAREGAEAVGQPFTPALRAPYRWLDWAAPYGE